MVKSVKIKWLASLSDGSTYIDGEEPWWHVEKRVSSWNMLQEYLAAKNLHITGIRIQIEKPYQPTRTLSLPSMRVTNDGRHEKYNLRYPIAPVGYNYFGWAESESNRSAADHDDSIGVEIQAIYDGFILSLIVDSSGNEIWAMVHNGKKKVLGT